MNEKPRRCPPRMRLILHVGIVSLNPPLEPLSRVTGEINKFLEELKKVLTSAHQAADGLYTSEIPLIRVISSLANPTEWAIVNKAIGMGCEHQGVIPFSLEEYKSSLGFPHEELRCLETAVNGSSALFSLGRSRSDERASLSEVHRKIILHSDLLFVLARKQSFEDSPIFIKSVLSQEIQGSEPLIICFNDDIQCEIFARRGVEGKDLESIIAERVQEITNPFHSTQEGGRKTRKEHLDYFTEKPVRWNFGFMYKAFVDLILWKIPRLQWRFGDFEAISSEGWNREWTTSDLPKEVKQKIHKSLSPHYAWSDNLSIYYANLYRTTYLSRYVFSMVAIIGIAIGFYGSESIQHLGFAMQFVSVAIILLLAYLSRKFSWHERYLDYRLLAERIRHLRFLSLIGEVNYTSSISGFNALEEAQWVNWHVRNIARGDGLLNATMTTDYLKSVKDFFREKEIGDQVEFYRGNSLNFRLISYRLEKIGMWSFYIGFMAILSRVGVYIYGYSFGLLDSSTVKMTKKLLNEASLIFPALGPFFLGIKSQGEFARLAKRYEGMVLKLKDISRQFDELKEISAENIGKIMQHSNQFMMEEVSDWRILLKARAISFM